MREGLAEFYTLVAASYSRPRWFFLLANATLFKVKLFSSLVTYHEPLDTSKFACGIRTGMQRLPILLLDINGTHSL